MIKWYRLVVVATITFTWKDQNTLIEQSLYTLIEQPHIMQYTHEHCLKSVSAEYKSKISLSKLDYWTIFIKSATTKNFKNLSVHNPGPTKNWQKLL